MNKDMFRQQSMWSRWYGSRERPQAAKAANFPLLLPLKNFTIYAKCHRSTHFVLTIWLLLKPAQRNPREGVGRLGLRVKFNQAISNIPKHRLTFSSLFVLRIVVRLRQRRLSLELGAQANLQDCINQSQEKCQPFTSRRNTTSSPGLESRQRAGFRIILPPSGC